MRVHLLKKRLNSLTLRMTLLPSFLQHLGILGLSETVRAAFPLLESKQHGKSHHRYIHGIEISVSDPTDLTAKGITGNGEDEKRTTTVAC